MFYFASIKKSDSTFMRRIKNLLGFIFIVASVILFTHSYKYTYQSYEKVAEKTIWETDYDKALEKAKKENKNLFIDFWAQYCAICLTIGKTTLQEEEVKKHLEEKVVPLMVDGTNMEQYPYSELDKKYKIIGFPTFLLINPKTETVIKKWNQITKKDILTDVK